MLTNSHENAELIKQKHASSFLTKASAFALYLVIIREALAGPIRLIFDKIGLSLFWFVPDALLYCALCAAIASALLSKKVSTQIIAAVSVFVVLMAVTVGGMNGNNIVSLMAGCKSLAPFLLCINRLDTFNYLAKKYFVLSILLILATFAFLWVNQFYQYEWVGMTFDQFGTTREGSRLWWSGDVQRYAGAATASFSAALLSVLLYCIVRPRLNLAAQGLVAGVCAYSIYLTQTKTVYFCLLLAFIMGNAGYIADACRRILNIDIISLSRRTLAVVFITVGAIPFTIGVFSRPNPYFSDNSFLDRVHFTWPSALERMLALGSWPALIYGTGFGSFGSSSYYNDKYIGVASDVDNFLIYQFAQFGFIALIIYAIIGIVVFRSRPAGLAFFGVFCCSALTTNCDQPLSWMMLGLGISAGVFAKPEFPTL